jgi:CheY-like chemotaxis protein
VDRTITAVASLLWPLLILAALIVYRRPLGRLLRSAERREWTLEIAGQKLSMGQVREQQSALISDLQRQLGTMRQDLGRMRAQLDAMSYAQYRQPSEPAAEAATDDALRDWDEAEPETPEYAPAPPDPWGAPASFGSAPPSAPGSAPPSMGTPPPAAPLPRYEPVPPPPLTDETAGYGSSGTGVLWVDDHPENNAILADSLLRDGVRIDTALSTDEALARLRRHRYAAVISDMGRAEDGADVPDAGLRLLDAVRRTQPALPFVIYCGERSALTYRDRALAAGATAITASPAEVVTQLQRLHLV